MVFARLVVLVSGSGTNLQALLDAADPPTARRSSPSAPTATASAGRARACRAAHLRVQRGLPTREEWDAALTEAVAAHEPDLVVSAGFMKIVGKEFLARFGGRFVNTHPALLPSSPAPTACATRSRTA